MNVCMLAYSNYESDNRVQQYSRALAERGDTVDVVALNRGGQPEHAVIDGVNLYRIQGRKRNEKGQLAYAFKIFLFFVRSALFITRKHWKQPYQLVHVHNVPDFLVFAAVIPKLTGAVVVLDIHDILPEFYASKFRVSHRSLIFKVMLLIEKLSTAFSDHVIVANRIWHERLISRSVPREKCAPICNYPNPRFFHPRPKTRNDGKFVIMYPGTLNWHQGLDIAIRAFARITDRIPEAEFHIYGEGPSKDYLVALAKLLGLDGKVCFKQFQPAQEIAKLMGDADLAVVPKRDSRFGREAQSTKILEFMAVGVPVIAPRVRITCLYHDESRLKLFEPENDADLADCMLQLARDRDLRNRLVAHATEHVRTHNWDVRKHEYLNLVDWLMGKKPGVADQIASRAGIDVPESSRSPRPEFHDNASV